MIPFHIAIPILFVLAAIAVAAALLICADEGLFIRRFWKNQRDDDFFRNQN